MLKPEKYQEYISLINEYYRFVYDEITCRIFYKAYNDKYYKILNTYDINTIYLNISSKIKISKELFSTIILSEHVYKRVNVIEEYLRSLEAIDLYKDEDPIAEYCSAFKVEDPEYFYYMFKKWFINMVAQVIGYGINQHCFILIGPQGIGKTTMLNKLVPEKLRKEYLYVGNIDYKNKDFQMLLANKILINIDEMNIFNKMDMYSIKNIITQLQINVRRPYQREEESFRRLASFCGTTNDEEIFTDLTGNRRFISVNVEDIYFDVSFDVNKMWKQALESIRLKEDYSFNRDDYQKINSANELHMLKSYEEEYIINNYSPVRQSGYIECFLTTTDVLIEIKNANQANISVNEYSIKKIGMILKKLGYTQSKKRINGYPQRIWVIYKPLNKNIINQGGDEDEIF